MVAATHARSPSTRTSDANSEISGRSARTETGNTRLTTDPRARLAARAGRPTAAKIAFASQRDGTPRQPGLEIYVMDADGTDVVRLTNAAAGSD